MEWVKLAENKDSWRRPWDCGTEPLGSIKCGVFLSSCKPVRSQEALFCVEYVTVITITQCLFGLYN